MKLQINISSEKNWDWSKIFDTENETDIYTVCVSGWNEEIEDWDDDTMLYVCEPGHCENLDQIEIDKDEYRNFAFANKACFKYILYWYDKNDAMKAVNFLKDKLKKLDNSVSIMDWDKRLNKRKITQ